MPWADQIYQWIAKDRLQLTRIHELLTARGCVLSYQSLRRFVLKRNWRRVSKTTVRMEDTPPGEAAEADFGSGSPKTVCLASMHDAYCRISRCGGSAQLAAGEQDHSADGGHAAR